MYIPRCKQEWNTCFTCYGPSKHGLASSRWPRQENSLGQFTTESREVRRILEKHHNLLKLLEDGNTGNLHCCDKMNRNQQLTSFASSTPCTSLNLYVFPGAGSNSACLGPAFTSPELSSRTENKTRMTAMAKTVRVLRNAFRRGQAHRRYQRKSRQQI